ncbi:MAG: acylphosphatase [Chloroflexi bacterium]|nr:acylphosphatase [Chloroflexota bacterium]
MTDLVSVQAIVYGYVQGVLFRDYVFRRATELGLTGYVRNLPGRSVEVNAEGRKKQLEKLIGYCKVGPPMAEVDKVVVNWSEYSGKFSHFSISY